MTDYVGDTGMETPNPTSSAFVNEATTVPALPPFDLAKYRSDIAALELTEDQERELLETIWSIMYSFVELGFRVDVCSALFDGHEIVASEGSEAVDSLGKVFQENANTDRGPT